MTDTPTVETVEVFNPYDSYDTDGYYKQQAWRLGKEAAQRDERDVRSDAVTPNPYEPDDSYARRDAWQEGYEGTGISASAFDNHELPSETNGIFIYPTVVPMGEERVSTAALVWSYDRSYDKSDEKTRPMWASLPESKRCIVVPTGHAWEAGRKWVTTPAIAGYHKLELPCPPYDFEVNGSELTISAGTFKKTGSKEDWQRVLETMQEEVENMPDGANIEDDYVNVTLSARVTGSITISASSLLSGHGQYEDGMFVGTEDEYHSAIEEAMYDYDWSYETSEMEIDTDYADWEAEDTDTSDLSSW